MNTLSTSLLYSKDGYEAKFCVMCVCPNLKREGDSAQQTLLYCRGGKCAPAPRPSPAASAAPALTVTGVTPMLRSGARGGAPYSVSPGGSSCAKGGAHILEKTKGWHHYCRHGTGFDAPCSALAFAAGHCAGAAIMLLLIPLLVLSLIL